MSQLHPDRHMSKSIMDQERFHVEASNVSLAYETIIHPQTRANHLLELNGTPLSENDSGTLVGNEFLLELMEIREVVDNTCSGKDLEVLMDENDGRLKNLSNSLSDAFQSSNLIEAKKFTAQLQYICRVRNALLAKM